MVKIYLIDKETGKRSKEYVNVSFWSIFKSNILAEIPEVVLGIIVLIVLFITAIII